MLENKEVGKHDFYGDCAPGRFKSLGNTFSVGIFQWELKADGKRLKKGPVKYRIKGSTSFPEKVYNRARVVCYELNKGWVPKHKSETVG